MDEKKKKINNNNESAKLRKNRNVFDNHNAASIGLKQQKESHNLEACATKCIDLSTVNIMLITKKD